MRITGWKVGAAVVAAVALVAVPATAAEPVDPAAQPVQAPTPEDTARAQSSLLRLNDLVRGFAVERKGTRAPLVPHCGTYPPDRSSVTITGAAASSFQHRKNSIASRVIFFATEADAERYWAATVRPAYVQCLAKFVPSLMVRTAKTKTLLAKRIPMGITGGIQQAAYRTITRVAAPGIPAYTWSETVAFTRVWRGIAIVRVVYVNTLCECHTEIARDLAQRLRAAHA
jgi:hypothetical protein